MRKFLLIFLFLICGSFARANEAEAEAPAEGGAEKGAAKKESKLPEWVEIQSRIQVLKSKVSSKQLIVEDLIRAKNHSRDEAQTFQTVQDLKREHAELVKLAEEYEQSQNLLRYRFPEKGLKGGTKYRRMEIKPLDELEKQMGMEGRLQRTTARIRDQYPSMKKPAGAGPTTTTLPPEAVIHSITLPPVLNK